MRDIWIPKAWLRIGTGLIALAIIAAIWINYRLELSRQAPPPERPAAEGASELGQERR
jgi:TRAP-type C4-dicarboxylate transport system permease small subunit